MAKPDPQIDGVIDAVMNKIEEDPRAAAYVTAGLSERDYREMHAARIRHSERPRSGKLR
jgi:hypothetical protein